MNPLAIVILLVAVGLGVLVFRLAWSQGWHWGLGLLLALLPVAVTFFFGILGLLGSALFVGALYKASGS